MSQSSYCWRMVESNFRVIISEWFQYRRNPLTAGEWLKDLLQVKLQDKQIGRNPLTAGEWLKGRKVELGLKVTTNGSQSSYCWRMVERKEQNLDGDTVFLVAILLLLANG